MDLSLIIVLFMWASLGSMYWQNRIDQKKNLELLYKIEKRLAALENQKS